MATLVWELLAYQAERNEELNAKCLSLSPLQIRHRFGLYDEITFASGRRTRHCNWVRFLKVIDSYGPQVSKYSSNIKCQQKLKSIMSRVFSHNFS
jgi:hypothetical protein